jgi:MacB-like periplasmic core domain
MLKNYLKIAFKVFLHRKFFTFVSLFGISFTLKVSIFTGHQLTHSYKNGAKTPLYLKRTDGEFWRILEFNFLEGGPFTAVDDKNANFVAVINDVTRKKFFGGESAIGKTIEVDGQNFRVVGVIDDFRKEGEFDALWGYLFTRNPLTMPNGGRFGNLAIRVRPGVTAS